MISALRPSSDPAIHAPCGRYGPGGEERPERDDLLHFMPLEDDQEDADDGPRQGAEHNGEQRAFPSEEAPDHAHELYVSAAHGLDVPELLPDPSDG